MLHDRANSDRERIIDEALNAVAISVQAVQRILGNVFLLIYGEVSLDIVVKLFHASAEVDDCQEEEAIIFEDGVSFSEESVLIRVEEGALNIDQEVDTLSWDQLCQVL